MNSNWKIVVQVFVAFLKIGPVSFGGGYAMLPLIEREVVSKRKWLKSEEITDVFAIAGSAPGTIAVNSAIFVGYRVARLKGALAALFGIILPTFLIVLLFAFSFTLLADNDLAKGALQGIKAAVTALIAYAALKMGKTAIFDVSTLLTTIATLIFLYFLHIHPALIVLVGILAGNLIIKMKEVSGQKVKFEKDMGKGK